MSRSVFFVVGRPPNHGLFLEEAFTPRVFERGFPAFFVEEAYRGRAAEVFGDTVERLEMLHYRHRIYPLEGYGQNRSLPPRPMARGYYFDQQKHFFENLPEYVSRPGIRDLAGRTPGATAVVAGAGPSLADSLDWIAGVADKAVVVCVNTALRALVGAGITPHVCVTVDHAEHTEQAFAGLPRLDGTVHAVHCLAPFAPEVFGRIAWCGEVLPSYLSAHPTPAWHGSVLTLAWSVARLMGCASCVFTGADLGSDSPWHMRYSRGTHMENRFWRDEGPPTGRYPQLYPVRSVAGERRYTTLNFRDVSLWLSARLEASGMALANTSKHSILTAPGMAFDPAPAVAGPVDARAALAGIGAARPVPGNLLSTVRGEVDGGLATWAEVRRMALEAASRPVLDQEALGAFEIMESQSVNYLVQRFQGYCNARFHERFFDSRDEATRLRALKRHFGYVAGMAEAFGELLARTRERLLDIDTI